MEKYEVQIGAGSMNIYKSTFQVKTILQCTVYLVNKNIFVDLWCGINRTPAHLCAEKQDIFCVLPRKCTTGRDTDAF